MTRLRYDGVTTTLAGPLSASATTIVLSSSLVHDGGTPVPTISGSDYIALSLLDADTNLREIVHLTAYTSGATTGTISRGEEGTTATTHAVGGFVRHSHNVADMEELQAATATIEARQIIAGTGLTGGGTLAADRTLSIDTTTEAERIRDTISTALIGGRSITITPDDAGDTITVESLTRTINAQTGTTYTLVLGDAGKFVTMTNAAASTLTVPPNSSVAFPVGTLIEGAQLGAGQVTLTPGAGVTINGTPGLKIAAQYGSFALLKTATDTWLAMGRLAA